MKLFDLLQVLTISSAKGVKLYTNSIAIDENLIFKGSYVELARKACYDNRTVFQILTHDYENYVCIILE